MAKYLAINPTSGMPGEVSALVTSTGATDAGKIPGLDSSGRLDLSVMPIGLTPDVETIIAFEDLSAGDLVNIFNNVGTRNVRKADCSNGRRAHGFIISAALTGAEATVYKDSTLTGLTIAAADVGIPYFLSTVGGVTKTPPTTAGYILQEVGYSVGVDSLAFEPQQPYLLA